MKKTLATILTLGLLLMSCAFAEQVPAINWSDAESAASIVYMPVTDFSVLSSWATDSIFVEIAAFLYASSSSSLMIIHC